LAQYIIIIGLFGAVCGGVSFILLFTLFESIGTIAADPISSFYSFFMYATFPSTPFITATILFSLIAFVINAIVVGATIKFTLDDYSGIEADIGMSISHSAGKLKNIIVVQLLISFLISTVTMPSLVLLTASMEGIDLTDPFDPIIPPGALEMMMQAMLLLLVGGVFVLYISARLAPTLAIVIDTDLSAIDSLKKSWELTSGNVIHVLAGQILLGIVVILIGAVASSLAFFVYPFDIVVGSIITALLFGSLNFIFAAVLYRDLNSRTDSSTLEELMV
jgi:membrane-anchored glycerophosphoryl diester phosphodiesterase (GDPDase)